MSAAGNEITKVSPEVNITPFKPADVYMHIVKINGVKSWFSWKDRTKWNHGVQPEDISFRDHL